MEDKIPQASESLRIIENMINTVKNRIAEDGFLYILWGWLVFGSAVLNYIALQFHSNYGYLVWPVLMPLGGVISTIYGIRKSKRERVKTYIDQYIGYAWFAFIVALFITLLYMPHFGMRYAYFTLMLLYGMITMITGGLLNFKPLVIGSLFSYAMAICTVYVNPSEQFICIAVSVMFSYIIPGHMLKQKFMAQKSNEI